MSNGTSVTLSGQLTQYRSFLLHDLPQMVYEMRVRQAFGGQTVLKMQTKLGVDPDRFRKVVTDTPACVETSVFLGKASKSFFTGHRRIGVRATEREGQTVVELFETKNMAFIVLSIGLLSCFLCLPAAIGIYANMSNSSVNRKVMAQAAGAIRAKYPDAVVGGTVLGT